MLDSPDVLVTASVFPEVDHLIQRLKLEKQPDLGGRAFYAGKWKTVSVGVLVTGPGMVNAAQAHTAAMEGLCPGLVIHTGCAGIFPSSGGDVGDLALAENDIDIHTGIEKDGNLIPDPLPFPLLETDSGPVTRAYPMNPDDVNRARRILEQALDTHHIRIFQGSFITASTITASDQRAQTLQKAFSPVMESMEGSAAAHVALHYGVPFLEIRAASNRVGLRDKDQWNLFLAFERCSTAVFHLIDRLSQWRPDHER